MARTNTLNNGAAALGFEAKLWAAAAMRNNVDAAECTHAVLGLIFLEYISDAFEVKQHLIHHLVPTVLAGFVFATARSRRMILKG